MFNWIKSFFVKEPDAPTMYSVVIGGVEHCRAETKESAEEEIRTLFESIDSKRVGGKGFGTNYNVSKNKRYNGFRARCYIRKICTICGERIGYCGQC